MKLRHIITGFSVVLLSATSFGQGATCEEMEPICTDEGIEFTAGVGTESEPGNDYGCLFSQPNPSWYYLEIAVGGDIEMALEAPSDIDFIIWGPFDDLADAQSNCGTLGDPGESPIVDCSYSASAYETPEITGCVPGEVYILLITNYAAVVQDVTLGKIGGDAETDCDIVEDPPCTAYAGTYTVQVNGVFQDYADPVDLCFGDEFIIESNEDYTLPNDTIDAPIGDGIYTAQIMWLVYDAPPIGDDPIADPGYLGLILPTEDLMDIHDEDSPIGDALGCGTYYLVPTAGDDGNGDGADNDNFSVTWDKDNNGCYDLGEPIQITYACPIEADITVNCGGDVTNGVDFELTGGVGDFTVVNTGEGDLVDGDIVSGGTATVANLENGDGYEIQVTDENGCTQSFSGVFTAPVISPIVLTPAVSCPDASLGNADVTIVDGSGNGAPYGLILNGIPFIGTNADLSDVAGTAVVIVAVDAEGCISDSVVTIPSAGHFIDTEVLTVENVTCFGADDGAASISANPVDEFGDDDGEVVSIIWTAPSGATFPGDDTNTELTGMEPGVWLVTILDDFGCEVTISIEVTSPAELDLYIDNQNDPTCYAFSDGSVDLSVTGGTPDYSFSWLDLPEETGDVLNTIGAGTYWGYVEDANGCQDSVQVIIGEPDSLWAEFTVKGILCYGDSTGSIIVDEVFNAAGEVNYFWDLNGTLPNPTPDETIADGLPVGTYLVTVQDEYCSNLYEFTLTQNPPIEFSEFEYEPAYCRVFDYQNGNGQVEVAAVGGVPDFDYIWTDLTTGATSTNTTWGGRNPGDYQILVTDDVGCTKIDTITVDSLNPEAIFTVTSDQLNEDCKGTELVFANFSNQSENFANPLNPTADTVFFWNLDTQNAPWILSEDIDEEFDTTYTGEAIYEVCLVALNKNGCADTTCKDIQVFALPGFTPLNIFSPNNDDRNDLFSFDQKASGVAEFTCVIVDRWGVEVKTLTSITDSWDGKRKNGQDSPTGTYFYNYQLTYTNGTGTSGQGTVTLVR